MPREFRFASSDYLISVSIIPPSTAMHSDNQRGGVKIIITRISNPAEKITSILFNDDWEYLANSEDPYYQVKAKRTAKEINRLNIILEGVISKASAFPEELKTFENLQETLEKDFAQGLANSLGDKKKHDTSRHIGPYKRVSVVMRASKYNREGQVGSELVKKCKFGKEGKFETYYINPGSVASAADVFKPFVSSTAHAGDESEYPGLEEAIRLSLETPTKAAPTKKAVVLLRGENGYNEFAYVLRSELENKKVRVKIVSTDKNIERAKKLLEKRGEEVSWPKIRDLALTLNKERYESLVKREDVDVIIYADMNKRPEFMEYYVELATQNGFPVFVQVVNTDILREPIELVSPDSQRSCSQFKQYGEIETDEIRVGGHTLKQRFCFRGTEEATILKLADDVITAIPLAARSARKASIQSTSKESDTSSLAKQCGQQRAALAAPKPAPRPQELSVSPGDKYKFVESVYKIARDLQCEKDKVIEIAQLSVNISQNDIKYFTDHILPIQTAYKKPLSQVLKIVNSTRLPWLTPENRGSFTQFCQFVQNIQQLHPDFELNIISKIAQELASMPNETRKNVAREIKEKMVAERASLENILSEIAPDIVAKESHQHGSRC